MIVAIVLGAVNLLSFFYLNHLNDNYQNLIKGPIEERRITQEIGELVAEQSSNLRGFLVTGEKEMIEQLRTLNAKTSELVNQLKESENMTNEVEATISDIAIMNESFLKGAEDVLLIFESNENLAIMQANYFTIPLGGTILEKTKSLIEFTENILAKSIEESNHNVASIIMLNIIILGAALIIAIITAIFISAKVTKPINHLTSIAEQVADGNLSVERVTIKGRDEIAKLGDSFNKMIDNLAMLITRVVDNSQQLATSSEQLSTSAEETTRASEHIVHSVESIASGAEQQSTLSQDNVIATREISENIQSLADSSLIITNKAEQSIEFTNEGSELINQTVENMKAISRSVEVTDERIQSLNRHSTQIDTILDVIRSIAEQTNLLALNAAIEAARAGQEGKGFAVVADEVRKLAEQSGNSTVKIGDIIKEIHQDINQSVQLLNNVKDGVRVGLESVDVTKNKFDLISTSIEDINEQITNLTAATQALTAKSAEITHAVEQISDVANHTSHESTSISAATEEALASMQEITSSATALSEMAEELQEITSQFRIGDNILYTFNQNTGDFSSEDLEETDFDEKEVLFDDEYNQEESDEQSIQK